MSQWDFAGYEPIRGRTPRAKVEWKMSDGKVVKPADTAQAAELFHKMVGGLKPEERKLLHSLTAPPKIEVPPALPSEEKP